MEPEIFYLDDFDECLAQSNASVFCQITAQLYPKNFTEPSNTWRKIEKTISDKFKYRHDLLRHGICVPKECWNYHETISTCLEGIYDRKYENLGLGAQIVEEECKKGNVEFRLDVFDTIFLGLVGVYSIFVLLVSVWLQIVKYQSKDSKKEISKIQKILQPFSFFDNLNFILSTSPQKDYMNFIQGIRFILSFLVIFFHVTGVVVATPFSNPSFVEKEVQSLKFMYLANGAGTVWMELFFQITCWFLAISFFKKLQKSKTIGFGYVRKIILKKYIRLTPPLALMIALHGSSLLRLYDGPFWKKLIGEEQQLCKKNWWQNLLYISNFYYGTATTCLLHSWTLSVELQVVLLGLLILWLVQKNPKNVFKFSGLLISVQIFYSFWVTAYNNYEISPVFQPEDILYMRLLNWKEVLLLRMVTLTHMSGLGTGLCFGYIYAYHNKKFFTAKSHTIFWWITSMTLIVLPTCFSSYYMTTEYYSKSRWFAATYGSVHQIIPMFGFGFLIFGMSQGLGGPLKKFLELPIMYPLGQLSFGAYLVHYTFLKLVGGWRTSLNFVSYPHITYEVIWNLSLSYLCSIVLTPGFIMPFAILSHLM